MTIHLDLKPEIEARLIAQAIDKGVSVEQYLQSWIETNLATETNSSLTELQTDAAIVATSSSEPSSSERAERFLNWTKRHASKVPPLSDESISRESIYREREDQQR